MSSSEPLPIVCKATKWFKSRAALMFLVFLGVGVWFYVDGNTGYRKKNEVFYLNQNFERAESLFKERTSGDQPLDAEGWQGFVSEQQFVFPDDADKVLPRDFDVDQSWPEELANYEQITESQNVVDAWEAYTARVGIGSKPGEKPYSVGDIEEQFWMAGLCAALAALVVFFFFRTTRREMVAGESTFSVPGKREAPYSAITKLDKRKWENKGLAFIYYDQDGEEIKGRIDGFCYGGLKKDEGELAEKYLAVVESRMSGEIIEYVEDEDEDEAAVDTTPAEKSE